jgi:hypothetical protein
VNYSHEENMNTPAQQPREICEHDAITKAWHDYHGPIHMEGEEDYVPAVPPLFMRGFVDGVEYAKRERDESQRKVAELQAGLDDIEEYGTEEINAAVDLRHQLAAALIARDEALNILREINDWINVMAMRPKSEITTNEVADAINTWGDKIRPILEVTE